VLHLRHQLVPGVNRFAIQFFMKNVIAKQPVDLLRRSERKNVLIAL
jgi:hypothetical protein